MNYLQLCEFARRESRVPGVQMTSVLNQSGLLADVVAAVSTAWLEIQLMHDDWTFMNLISTVSLIVNQSEYTTADFNLQNVSFIHEISFQNSPLRQLSYIDFVKYQNAQANVTGSPQIFTEAPDRKIHVHPIPDQEHEILVHYKGSPVVLTNNDDEPQLPVEYRRVIAWKAVMDLAANESDSVIYQKALEKYESELDVLMRQFLPEMKLGTGMFA